MATPKTRAGQCPKARVSVAKVPRRSFMAGALVTAAAGVLGMPRFAHAQTATQTVFTNAALFDGLGLTVRQGMNVLVEGERVAAIVEGTMTAPDGATVIDCAGRTLMPGMIDNHVHLFMTGSSQAAMMDPSQTFESLNAIAAEEARLMVLRGFTSVRDVGGPVFALKRAIDSGEAVGPRIYPSGAMISQTSGHGDFRTLNERSRRFGGTTSVGELMGVAFIADGRDEVLTAVRENLRAGATQIKLMAGGGAASAYDPLDVAQYTFDELLAAVQAADDWGTYVCTHAYTTKAVRRCIDAGVKCIEHGQLLEEDTIKMLADNGIFLSLQVLSPAPPTQTPDVIKKKQMVIDGTDTAFTFARKHNVKLAYGSDYLFNPKQNLSQGADAVKLLQWFSPAETLQLLTARNADLLALCGPRNPYDGKLGVIEVGAFADVLLVDGDPAAQLDLIADPVANFKVIMKGGQIYKNSL
ncbi:amidohydrolase family protein [Tabrizicola sp. BL-A-41-H6]|uniref:metal-dependent hydrolase family protein n=1 Tax=Tabrizicola sp. BL-A-41-H6 TaxID=3421107 RepID=UPI003D676236